MRRTLILLFACLASACCSMSKEHRASAARVSAQALRTLPAVARRLGVPPRPVEVELACGQLDYDRLGIALEDRIVLAPRAVDQPFTEYVLAHEFVHILLPEDLRMLPGAVQEGLADFIAVELEPGAGALRVNSLRAVLASGVHDGWGMAPAEAFELTLEQVGEMADPLRHEFVYALGLALVSRLGLERLSELCRGARAAGRARLPVPLLCAHAGLDDTTLLGWSIELEVPNPGQGGGPEWTWSGRVEVRRP